MKTKTILVCMLLLTGCASRAVDVAPAYFPPTAYQSYTCDQLTAEARAVSQQAAVASQQQDANRVGDQIRTTVGAVVFWPVILLNKGDGADAARLAQLKGQMQAIEQASNQKRCNIQFRS